MAGPLGATAERCAAGEASMTYAADTKVPIERSGAEIERLLARYGATSFISGWDERGATIGFAARGRRIKFHLPLPARDEKRFTRDRYGYTLAKETAEKRWSQECRARWRALCLAIKAKLEIVESGISTFESEFLAHVVTDDGRTIGEIVLPQLGDVRDGEIAYPRLGDGT